jgi:hypothetical protein
MAELYCDDPEFALEVVNTILENGDQTELPIVSRQMVKAYPIKAVADSLSKYHSHFL